MSKMDAVRAMREARYAEAQARAGGTPTPRATPKATPPARAKKSAAKPAAKLAPAGEPEAADDLCGHRNISGRTCTRERGHSAKSHRYG